MRLLSTAASGLQAQQLALDTIGNNMANVSTPGFKAGEVSFADTLATQEYLTRETNVGPAAQDQTITLGSGVLCASTRTNQAAGTFVNTDNPLDLAIDGNGFFQVTTAGGQVALTRAGNFKTDANGTLTDQLGNKVVVQTDFRIPQGATNLVINQQGQVSCTINGNDMVLGNIVLATVPSPQELENIGNNLFLTTQASGPASTALPGTAGAGTIMSKSIEQSNVDLASSMTDLVQAQRSYQLNVRMMQDGDQMWSIANSLRR